MSERWESIQLKPPYLVALSREDGAESVARTLIHVIRPDGCALTIPILEGDAHTYEQACMYLFTTHQTLLEEFGRPD